MSDKNAKYYAEKPRSEIRRGADYGQPEDWTRALLLRGAFATLATSLNDQPFITPLLYIYIEEDEAIYFHTAQVGRLWANIQHNPQAALNVSEFGRLLPHQDAVDFNVEYNSATVFGPVTLIEEEDEARRYLQALLDKYAPHLTPGADYNPIQPEEIKRTAVYRLQIEDMSGKRQKEARDYPGAFHYPHPTTLIDEA